MQEIEELVRSMASPVGTSFWRVAGVSYLKYVQLSTQAVVNCLKNPEILKGRTELHFRERAYNNGVAGEKGKAFGE